eukprot:scaffold58059_cov22-Cyclotella_meneghiniana.AAC.2
MGKKHRASHQNQASSGRNNSCVPPNPKDSNSSNEIYQSYSPIVAKNRHLLAQHDVPIRTSYSLATVKCVLGCLIPPASKVLVLVKNYGALALMQLQYIITCLFAKT